MRKTKFLKWFGFLMVIASLGTNGMIRHKGSSNNILLSISVAVMAIGATITFVAFFIGKRR